MCDLQWDTFSTYFLCLFLLWVNCSIFFLWKKGFWFRFCPRQLTTNCPTQLPKERPWVKEIPYGKAALRSATKTRLKSFEVKKEPYAARLTCLRIFLMGINTIRHFFHSITWRFIGALIIFILLFRTVKVLLMGLCLTF